MKVETGAANVIVWKQVYEAFRKAVVAWRLVRVTGSIQRDGPTTHLIAERVEDVLWLLATLGRPVIIEANDGRRMKQSVPLAEASNHQRAMCGSRPRSCSQARISTEKKRGFWQSVRKRVDGRG